MIDWLSDPTHWSGPDGVPSRVLEHLQYSAVALAVALVIASAGPAHRPHRPGGLSRRGHRQRPARAADVRLLLLAFMVLSAYVRGEAGFLVPMYVVLVILAAPPVLAGTYAGVEATDPDARDAAYGMGMTGRQVLWRVEVPSALPLFMSGVRSATLQIVATATIAAYIGLGGLGRIVIDGLAGQDYAQVVAGAVLVSLLAVVLELVLAWVQRLVVPRGLSGRYARQAQLSRSEPGSASPGSDNGGRGRRRGRRRPALIHLWNPSTGASPPGTS